MSWPTPPSWVVRWTGYRNGVGKMLDCLQYFPIISANGRLEQVQVDSLPKYDGPGYFYQWQVPSVEPMRRRMGFRGRITTGRVSRGGSAHRIDCLCALSSGVGAVRSREPRGSVDQSQNLCEPVCSCPTPDPLSSEDCGCARPEKSFYCGERITPTVIEATTPHGNIPPYGRKRHRIKSSRVETRQYIIEEYIDQMLHKMRYK